jgi:hypothetical protein
VSIIWWALQRVNKFIGFLEWDGVAGAKSDCRETFFAYSSIIGVDNHPSGIAFVAHPKCMDQSICCYETDDSQGYPQYSEIKFMFILKTAEWERFLTFNWKNTYSKFLLIILCSNYLAIRLPLGSDIYCTPCIEVLVENCNHVIFAARNTRCDTSLFDCCTGFTCFFIGFVFIALMTHH